MIQFAKNEHLDELKSIWKICFGDSDKYIDLIFSKKFKLENTLVYVSQGKVVANLQMQEYNIRMYDSIVPFYYMVGLCTLPEHRGKGYMGQLIEKSFEVLKDRNIPLSILVPAEDSLVNYYNRFGYEETFDKGSEQIELERILKENKNTTDAFEAFDRMYQKEDFCVLKNEKDFEVIAEDYSEGNYPPRYNLRAMTKIINQQEILSIYAKKNRDHRFIIRTKNLFESGDVSYLIENGNISEIESLDDKRNDVIAVNERHFTKLMFGYKLTEEDMYQNLFKQHNPIINLMLE